MSSVSVCSFDPGGHERDGRVRSVCSFDPGGHERGGRVSSGLCAALILAVMRGMVECVCVQL